MVLIADPEVEQGKSTASALAQWGLQPTLVHDGVEAILAIQRLLPRAIVIDAALPKMFGFQICEIVKRNESLREIHVVLVGAIHNQNRYRRPPEEIYGADAYIERQDLPDSLRSILQGFGMLSSASESPVIPAAAAIPMAPPVVASAPTTAPAVEEMPAAETPAARQIVEPVPTTAPVVEEMPAAETPAARQIVDPVPTTAPVVEEMPAAETPAARQIVEPVPTTAPVVEEMPAAETPAARRIVEPVPTTEPAVATEPSVVQQTPESVAPLESASEDSGVDEEVEQAERLARIVVSDIVLYSKEKFEAAVQAGNVLEAMQPEIAEGRSLFVARVDASIQETRDFLTEELLRVAEARGKP
jgi:CheY-like chemotaxis protein